MSSIINEHSITLSYIFLRVGEEAVDLLILASTKDMAELPFRPYQIIVDAEKLGLDKDFEGVGSRVNHHFPRDGVVDVARYILNNPDKIWYEAGNAYPDVQLPEFRGMPTLYPTNDRSSKKITPHIKVNTTLFVFKKYMDIKAHFSGGWDEGQGVIAKDVKAWKRSTHKPSPIIHYMTTSGPVHPLLDYK